MKSSPFKYFFALLLIMLYTSTEAQNKKKTPLNSDWEAIISNPSYLWGLGTGETLEDADKNALSNLVSKISVAVTSDYLQRDLERWQGGDGEASSQILNTVRTFSSATLTNTESIVLSNEPDAMVGRYMQKSELTHIFDARKTRVDEFVRYGLKAQSRGKIDDALRYYQWANVLLSSLPSASSYKLVIDGTPQALITWIPMRQDEILDNLKISMVERKGSDVVLSFKYEDRPVASIDYSCFDGRSWSNIYSAKDGVGVVELPSDENLDRIQLRIEYQYRSQSHIDREVEDVMNAVKTKAIRSAYINVELPDKEMVKRNLLEKKEGTADISIHFLDNPKNYEILMKKIAAAITSHNPSDVENIFTNNGYDMFNKLVTYGNARILDDKHIKYYSFRDGIVARGMNMLFSFDRSVQKSFVEDVVFSFNKDGLVDCLAFALGRDELKSILGNTYWNEVTRMSIAEFLENYKTAYCLKRLDYLKAIYDDNAVIIVGHVARKYVTKPTDGAYVDYSNNKVVTRTRYSKEQYMRSLENCFKSQEFVNIRLTGNEIRKFSIGGETYGIQIKQDYYSTTYGDSGYLYLMVDLNSPGEPVIKVRTWQECTVPIDQLVSSTDF